MYWVNTMVRKLSWIEPTQQKFVPAHFVLIFFIVLHLVKHQSVINKYMQKSLAPENDAGFLKVIIIAAVHVASSTIIIHTLLSLE